MLERYNKAVNSSDGIAALGADKNVDKKKEKEKKKSTYRDVFDAACKQCK